MLVSRCGVVSVVCRMLCELKTDGTYSEEALFAVGVVRRAKWRTLSHVQSAECIAESGETVLPVSCVLLMSNMYL